MNVSSIKKTSSKEDNMKFTLYTAKVSQRKDNCYYPNKVEVLDEATLIEAIKFDNVSAEYKDNYRSIENFIGSDNIVMDCDNDHSDDPKKWIDEKKIEGLFGPISYALVFSRNHNKQKGQKTARPRFHIYFPIKPECDKQKYADLKKLIYSNFTFFDGNALDSARFIFGTETPSAVWHNGSLNIDDFLSESTFEEYDTQTSAPKEIKEGGRNNHMSKYAAKVLKRYGNGEEAYNLFIEESNKCNPPLEDSELKVIWNSALSFFNRISKNSNYVSPEDYANDWRNQLVKDKHGVIVKSLNNLLTILECDENLQGIVFNQLADGMEIKGDVPWKHPARFWRDADDAQLICYIDKNYGEFPKVKYETAVMKVADDRSYHPIRSYFDSLPEWDGIKRVDTFLIDYFGADDNPYVRTITRKTLCAAYMRIKSPGIKFDNILVLNGPQGIGKSTAIAKLGMDWYSDSLNVTDMNDKTAAEKLQGYWILEIGELAGMKKADIDKVKAFISRQDDKYRASFGRRVTPHPRQCIFFATTNSETGFLRDVTGNRRFWTVKVLGNGIKKPWQLTSKDVRQIWAEVVLIANAGEKLYLDENLEKYAAMEQNAAMEQDDREGLVREYLEELIPDNWYEMTAEERSDYLSDTDHIMHKAPTKKRAMISNIEIWCECFGKRKEDIKPADSYAIKAIITRIDGWEKTEDREYFKIYGRQRVYRRAKK